MTKKKEFDWRILKKTFWEESVKEGHTRKEMGDQDEVSVWGSAQDEAKRGELGKYWEIFQFCLINGPHVRI